MNKVALVTGGTSGIGKEIVKELLEKGNKVITCYSNNDENARNTEKEFNNPNLMIIKCDVSNEEEVINMFNKIGEVYGKIDYLVNNAGIVKDSLIKDFDINDFKRIFDVNFFGKVLCTKHAYNYMNDNGAIVNISSHLGVVPCAESAAYCTAASAIINFTKATALEYANKKIRANSITPEFTPTPLSLVG